MFSASTYSWHHLLCILILKDNQWYDTKLIKPGNGVMYDKKNANKWLEIIYNSTYLYYLHIHTLGYNVRS